MVKFSLAGLNTTHVGKALMPMRTRPLPGFPAGFQLSTQYLFLVCNRHLRTNVSNAKRSFSLVSDLVSFLSERKITTMLTYPKQELFCSPKQGGSRADKTVHRRPSARGPCPLTGPQTSHHGRELRSPSGCLHSRHAARWPSEADEAGAAPTPPGRDPLRPGRSPGKSCHVSPRPGSA